ncbi:MAG TPA: helix-turn-helix transcriptional regulator [Polyangiaceae bacterium]
MPSQVDRKAVEVTKEIGRRIAQLRKEAGWSQKEFAAVLNSTVQWVSLVENGRQNLTIHTLVRLAHKLGVEPRDLWDAAAPEPKKSKRGRGRPRGFRAE